MIIDYFFHMIQLCIRHDNKTRICEQLTESTLKLMEKIRFD